MTWYYADWSWTYTLTTAVAVVTGCVLLAAATFNLIRSALTARRVPVTVTNGFVPRSSADIERERHHAPSRARPA